MSAPDFESEFRQLLTEPQEMVEPVPSSLKARLYTALIHKQQETGPLASLDSLARSGRGLCAFEKLVQIAPLGEAQKSQFFCQVCHARILAERFDNPPIFWAHCPYVLFKPS